MLNYTKQDNLLKYHLHKYSQYLKIYYYSVPHTAVTHLLENIYFALQQVFFLNSFLSFFLHPMPYSIPSFLNVTTPLQCFHKGFIQSNQQLALSWLTHSIHCSSAIQCIHKVPLGFWKTVARKQIELATWGLQQITVKLWKFFFCRQQMA
jgi:hypothetical protein